MLETITKYQLKKLFEKAQRLPKDIYALDVIVEWTPSNPGSTLYAFTTQLRRGEINVQAIQLCIYLRCYILKNYGESSPYLRRLNELFFIPYFVESNAQKNENLHRNQWINARIELVGLLGEMIQTHGEAIFPFQRYFTWEKFHRIA
jgi:hypothetical protein